MAAPHSGFLAAHVARGTRNVLLLGAGLTVLGAGLSGLFDNAYGFLFFGVPGLIALGVWAYRRALPSRHSAYTQLARFGDPAALAAEVDAAFAGAPVDKAPLFGERWLAQGDTYGVHVVPWREVAWLYPYTKVQNGVKARFVRVWTRDKRTFVVPTAESQETQEAMLTQLYARAPWAETGYSDEHIEAWQRDRAAFIARVDARRGGG